MPDDVRYKRACQAAAEVVNQHMSADLTRPAQFHAVLFCLLRMMQAVEDDRGIMPWKPSEN